MKEITPELRDRIIETLDYLTAYIFRLDEDPPRRVYDVGDLRRELTDDE